MRQAHKLPRLPNTFRAPELRALIAALGAGGNTPRLVGGCVRDWLLGRTIGDIDVAIDAPPDAVLRLLRAAKIRAIPTGVDHGTVTAISGDKSFEITSLRQDIITDGRHAVVQFGTDWHADAMRRDFTVNALYYDFTCGLIDPLCGLDDLRTRRLRFIGDARQRIREDYLRSLRLFRFYGQLDFLPPDQAAIAAVKGELSGLAGLSAERVRQELQKILAQKNAPQVLSLMKKSGVLGVVLPEAKNLNALAKFVQLRPAASWLENLALMVMAKKSSANAARAETVIKNLKLSNAEADFLRQVLSPAHSVLAAKTRADFRAAWYYATPPIYAALADMYFALGYWTLARRRAAKAAVHALRAKEFPLRGQDLLDAGLRPGPGIGQALRHTESWWVEKDCKPNKKQCLAFALKNY
jgi:poly(A) polymerase